MGEIKRCPCAGGLVMDQGRCTPGRCRRDGNLDRGPTSQGGSVGSRLGSRRLADVPNWLPSLLGPVQKDNERNLMPKYRDSETEIAEH